MLSKILNSLIGSLDKNKMPATTSAATKSFAEYKRFNDAVLVISQENNIKKLPIKSCNERAIKLIGYSENEILSLDFRDLLPPDTAEIVSDYLEFDDNERGIDQILQRISNFKIMGSRGRKIPVKVRVIRDVSNSGSTTYRIILNDATLLEVLAQARIKYSALAEKEFLQRDIAQVIKHGQEFSYESCLALISFTDPALTKRAHKMIESTKRDTDIVGFWNENILLYIMPDTPPSNATVPLIRFKNSLPNGLNSNLFIRYSIISHLETPLNQIQNCLNGSIGTVI